MKSERSENIWKPKANSIPLIYYTFRIRFLLIVSLQIIIFQQKLFSQKFNSIYSPGDWVTYLNSRTITSISDGDQYIYFGTTNGIIRYNMLRREWANPINKSNGMDDDFVYSVAVDRNNGIVWISTRSGLSRFEEYNELITNVSAVQLNLFQSERILSIGFNSNSMWLETTSGYVELDRLSGFFKRKDIQPPDNIRWAGLKSQTFNKDMIFFMSNGFEYQNDGYSAKIIDDHLREYDITSTLTDEFGNQYSGTCGSGVFMGNSKIQTLDSYNYGLLENHVSSIAVDDEFSMWIGGYKTFSFDRTYNSMGFNNCHESSGIVKWNMIDDEWTYYENVSDVRFDFDDVRAIEIGENNIWFGTGNGILYYEKSENEWHRINAFDGLRDDRIMTISIFDSSLWVGSKFNIQTIDLITKMVTTPAVFRELNLNIYDIKVDSTDLWIGTSSGAFKIDGSSNKIFHFSNIGEIVEPQSGGGGNVKTVAFNKNYVWLSDDLGVSQINKINREHKRLPLNPIIFKGNIRRMTALEDYLWVGTSLGLLRYDIVHSTWRKYSTADGLANNSVNDLYIGDDYVWIATNDGLTQFYWNNPDRFDN